MVLHVHEEHTDKLKLEDVADEFIGDSEHGQNILESNNNRIGSMRSSGWCT